MVADVVHRLEHRFTVVPAVLVSVGHSAR
jgi:hypothetical protein